MSLSKYVIAEARFGVDIGAEKLFDIKCTHAGLKPKLAVVVTTVRALRHHGEASKEEYNTPDVERVTEGCENLIKHVKNIKKIGVEPIVAINRFISDTPEEWQIMEEKCAEIGVKAVVSDGWAKGGDGVVELGKEVVRLIEENNSDFKPLYNVAQTSVVDKIKTISKEIYGADNVNLSQQAKKDLQRINDLGLDKLPVCIAKTQNSFSDDPSKANNPQGFDITIREFEIAAGAGFIVPILDKMMRMPGLPSYPASEGMDIDSKGIISGIS